MENKFRVLMFPWLAYGHISPFLELAKKLSKNNFYVYFLSTPVNLNFIENKLTSDDLSSIELVELHLPSSPELPPHYHTTKGLPRHLIGKLIEEFQLSKPSFMSILNTIKPHLVIYDGFQPWVPDMASSLQIPAIFFYILGASAFAFYNWLSSTRSSGLPHFPFPAIFLHPAEMKDINASLDDMLRLSIEKSLGFIIVKSCNVIEEKYLNYMTAVLNKKALPVGLLTYHNQEDNEDQMGIMKWLDSKEKASTVFVSFGSENYLSKKEIEELGCGLELSGVNFIWVIRFPADDAEKLEIKQLLPEGFLDRVKGRGMIVEGWAPQDKILGHPNTGGFISHCGWGSTTESMSFGVPIIGLPRIYDMPLNARLVVELGVGLEIEKDENLEFTREEVARVVKEVVNSEVIRKKAKELSENIKMKEDQVTLAAVEELRNICTNSSPTI